MRHGPTNMKLLVYVCILALAQGRMFTKQNLIIMFGLPGCNAFPPPHTLSNKWHNFLGKCIKMVSRTRLNITFIQGYSKWLSGYNCPAAIRHQIRETTTIWQFHSKVVCTVSRDRVRVYPGMEGTNQNQHGNHQRWHAERTRLLCWCLWNYKGCTYRTPVRYVTKTWNVVLLNKKNTYTPISSVFCMTSC